jgi:hypothetical protein
VPWSSVKLGSEAWVVTGGKHGWVKLPGKEIKIECFKLMSERE